MDRKRTELLIVGAGPIGLELAIAVKAAGLDYVHLDAGQIGQTITWYPKETRFFSSPERIALANVPLHNPEQAKASREEYLTYLRSIVEQFELNIHTYERVTHIERHETGFHITSERQGTQQAYEAKYVVLAIGDMHRPRRLGVPGEELEHVSHYFDEPHRYFHQRLLIVGGKNSAAEAALRCHRAGARVSISYRRPWFNESSIKYWLMPELGSLIRNGHIGFHPCTRVERIEPGKVRLGPSDASDCDSPVEPFDAAADFVLLLTGYEQDTTLFEIAGVNLEGESRTPEHDPQTMETNVPGLFVAGTAAAGTQHRYRLFIENCHVHVARIVQAITGRPPEPHTVNAAVRDLDLPES